MRECDCPEWAKCVHFGEEVLQLLDFTYPGSRCPCDALYPPEWRIDYTVKLAHMGIRCPDSTDKRHTHSETINRYYTGKSHEEALIAFYSAEEKLLHDL